MGVHNLWVTWWQCYPNIGGIGHTVPVDGCNILILLGVLYMGHMVPVLCSYQLDMSWDTSKWVYKWERS